MFSGISANLGERVTHALFAFIAACALSLAVSTTARADWNPLAPITGPTADFGEIAVEYNPDGTAASVWAVDYGAVLQFTKYSADGQTVLDSFTTDLFTPGVGEVLDPYGLAIDGANDLLYVSDGPQNRVIAFDVSTGTETAVYQAPGGPGPGGNLPTQCPGASCPVASSDPGSFGLPGPFSMETGAGAIALYNDEVYVIDADNARIQVFNAQLEYQRSITGAGWEAGIPDVTNGVYPETLVINQSNGNLLVGLSDGTGIEEYNNAGTLIRTLPINGAQGIALDHLNNVLYAADGSDINAYDFASGTFLALAYSITTDWLSGTINSVALQPVERELLTGYWYEYTVDSYATDLISRFSYDAPPTCVAATAAAQGTTPVTFSLSCNDASPGGPATYELLSQPTAGTISGFNPATGALTYAANANAVATDTFSYRAMTESGFSEHYTATVTVGEAVPVIRSTANLERSSGDIYVKLPGTDEWVKLEKNALVPIGTIIDAANGYCVLTFANADGSLYEGTFWGGVFQILQGDGAEPYAILKLRDDEFPGAPSQAGGTASASSIRGLITSLFRPPSYKSKTDKSKTAASKGKKKNKLWGKGKGKFRTSGDGSSASVRGTRWGVTNYANGTVTQVTSGVVVVRDFYRKRNITLRRGQSYFADKNWKKNRATARAKPRFTG